MTEIGTVYGEALYTLCRDEGVSKIVLDELSVVEICLVQSPEFIRLLRSPALNKAERCDILQHCFHGRVQPYLLNFVKILTEKGYLRHFSDCCRTYHDCFRNDHNILIVTATTPEALNEAQSRRLTEKLSAMTGKTVHLQNRIDGALVGGIMLDYDGKRLEDTIANRLRSIRSILSKSVL